MWTKFVILTGDTNTGSISAAFSNLVWAPFPIELGLVIEPNTNKSWFPFDCYDRCDSLRKRLSDPYDYQFLYDLRDIN